MKLFTSDSAAGRDGDITIDAPIFIQGGGADGRGGDVLIDADDDVELHAPVSASGKHRGGDMEVYAGGAPPSPPPST